MNLLTQNDFMTYLQLPKHFWAKVHKQTKEVAYTSNLPVQKLKVLAADYTENIVLPNFVEATMETKVSLQNRNFLARADAIITENESKKAHLLAFKAATSSNSRIIQQLAFQTIIAQDSYNFDRIFVILLSSHYLQSDKTKLDSLFQVIEVTQAVKKEIPRIEQKMKLAIEVADYQNPETLFSCVQPERCPCPHLCHPHLPEYSIFDMSGYKSRDLVEMRDQGILKIEDIPLEFLSDDKQRLQKRLTVEKTTEINKPELDREMSRLEYPIHFLDYEAFGFPVPMYPGYWPMSSVVFQFSLHTLNQDGNLEHHEFLHLDRTDPSDHLIKALKESLPPQGSIVVWDKTLEESVHNHLAKLRTQNLLFLLELNQRLFDLQQIFRQGIYQDYRFKGSVSLKKVLPVFAPELNYQDLSVSNGLEAAQNWYQLVFNREEQNNLEETKNGLREYCSLDTFGCVQILKHLQKISSSAT